MIRHLESFANDEKEIDAKELMTDYNLDVICRTGFGVEANSFTNVDDNLLTQMVCLNLLIESVIFKNCFGIIIPQNFISESNPI